MSSYFTAPDNTILWWGKRGSSWHLCIDDAEWIKASRSKRITLAVFLPDLEQAYRKAVAETYSSLEEAIEAANTFAATHMKSDGSDG